MHTTGSQFRQLDRNYYTWKEICDEIEPLLEKTRKCHERLIHRKTRQTIEDFRRQGQRQKKRRGSWRIGGGQKKQTTCKVWRIEIALKKIYHRANLITGKENILVRRKAHFVELLNSDAETDETVLEKLNQASTMQELGNEITMVELEYCINL